MGYLVDSTPVFSLFSYPAMTEKKRGVLSRWRKHLKFRAETPFQPTCSKLDAFLFPFFIRTEKFQHRCRRARARIPFPHGPRARFPPSFHRLGGVGASSAILFGPLAPGRFCAFIRFGVSFVSLSATISCLSYFPAERADFHRFRTGAKSYYSNGKTTRNSSKKVEIFLE